GAELVDLVLDVGLGAVADADGEDDRGDADEDPEHRQRRAQAVAPDGLERGPEGVAPAHDGRIQASCAAGSPAPTGTRWSVSTLPSRISTTRRARSAMSRSWVIRTMVEPSPLSCSTSSRTSAVDDESRLPVGSSARMTAGSVTSAR